MWQFEGLLGLFERLLVQFDGQLEKFEGLLGQLEELLGQFEGLLGQLFPLIVVLWWALANFSCMPNLQLLASAVAQILKGYPKILGRCLTPRPHPLFLWV